MEDKNTEENNTKDEILRRKLADLASETESLNNEENQIEVEGVEQTDVNSSNEEQIKNDGEANSELFALSAKVSELETALKESKESYLRLIADFENYKKNVLKRESEMIKYQGEKVFVDLLDVIDNFERAIDVTKESNKDSKDVAPDYEKQYTQLLSGVELIYKDLLGSVTKWGLKSESAIGKQFDPNTQNAISKIPASEGQEEGTVVAELKKAYWYKDKVIRIGDVVVAG